MVLGVATGLLGLGLALPTGLAFGYGYGYGVRQGYSAFKQPSKTAQGLKMSPDPVQGSLGMGLQTAEERTGFKTPDTSLSTGPSLQSQGPALLGPRPNNPSPFTSGDRPDYTEKTATSLPAGYVQNSSGQVRKKSSFKSHEEFRLWMKRPKYKYRR